MPRPARLISLFFAVGFCGLVGAPFMACLAPTQLTLELRTDATCASVKGVTITVGAPGTIESSSPTTSTTTCTGEGYIGTIAVAPKGDKDARIAIRAVLGIDLPAEQCTAETKYQGCIVVRRELNFVPHTTSVVSIGFYRACQNVSCEGTTTCNADRQCVSSGTDLGRRDAGVAPSRCTEAKDCPALVTSPASCAEAVCEKNACRYVSKDADGDGDLASNCESQVVGISVKVGTDCDDADPIIHGSTQRKCTVAGACGSGAQACDPVDPRKVGPCEGATISGPFDCNNKMSDSDCNGILDIDELVKLQAPDSGNVCANIFRCPKGTVLPDRAALCRNDNGTYTLDCGAVAGATLVGFVSTLPLTGFPPNTVSLAVAAGRTKVFPSGVASSCNPGTSSFALCDASGNTCAITSLPLQ